ncbi:pentapeptide repeat-containing protein [Nostoc sp. UCD121]|nr:pentapeptide repeat-containing protein [Nostoc sp. UCD121]MBC1279265.1 pentapeptide repeat-containing protein [Nostoc sp. UCD121]
MPQDFSRQNLRGRSFKGQDLTGANFSYADIRGTDFTGANLRGANFSCTEGGLQRRWATVLVLISWVLSGISGLFSGTLVSLLADVLKTDSWKHGYFIATFISLSIFLIITIRRGISAGLVIITVITSFFFVSNFIISTLFGFLSAVFYSETTIKGVTIIRKYALPEVVNGFISIITFGSTGLGMTAIVFGLVFTLFIPGVVAFIIAEVKGLIGVIACAGFVTSNIAFTIITTLNIIFPSEKILQTQALLASIIGATAVVISSTCIAFYNFEDETQSWFRLFIIVFTTVKSTNFQDANLTDANFNQAMLKSANFKKSNLTRTYWENAKKIELARLGTSYLQDIKLRQLLVTGQGQGIDLNNRDLRGLNFSGFNLVNANFSGSDIYQCSFRKANMTGALFVKTRIENTDLTGITLTGACIEDWIVTKTTKLQDIKCRYIFMKLSENGDKRNQMPIRGEFKNSDFVQFIESILDTIELYHDRNIDPKAAVIVLKSLSEDYDEHLQVVGLETRENQIIVKVKTSKLANPEQLREEYYTRYNQTFNLSMQDPDEILPQYKVVETNPVLAKITQVVEEFKQHPTTNIEYFHNEGLYMNQNSGIFQNVSDSNVYGGMQAALGNNNRQIQETNINTDTMTNNPGGFSVGGSVDADINNVQGENNQQKVSNKSSSFNLQGAQFGGGLVNADTVNAHQIGGNITNYTSEQKQNLAAAAAEIQQLLNQLSQTSPTATTSEKMTVVARAVDEIENNPTLKARVIGALKTGGTEAFKELIDHPLVNILLASIEGWQEAE